MTAQIIIVFEIRRFFMILSEIFKKNLDVKRFQNFEDVSPVIFLGFFFLNFSEKLGKKNLTKLLVSLSIVRLC